ncbi:MAG: prepilin-type N-terminal cleavage/methylation domain-containing protein [bacterium]
MLSRRKKQSGFTLIEILIVVVIVAILAAISVPIYVEYVRSARAADAQATIGAIWNAAQIFQQDLGRAPGSVEELERMGYLKIQEATRLQWTFQLVGDPITSISGTSTARMRGGEGKTVTYNTLDGTFYGYGFPVEEEGTGGAVGTQ